jgi:hypothetical protein
MRLIGIKTYRTEIYVNGGSHDQMDKEGFFVG